MLTLFHAPRSRSTRIVALIDEMGIADRIDIVPVDIARADATGAADPRNPHPEGKVPCLIHDGTAISETGAVILYLTALFPDSGLAPKPGSPLRGTYLTWLFWYGSVMEPVILNEALGVEHPGLWRTFRGRAEMEARLRAALEKGPWLLGDTYSAADLLIHSPFAWFREATPQDPLIREWVERCIARPSTTFAADYDTRVTETA